jgi:hypothetical protein
MSNTMMLGIKQEMSLPPLRLLAFRERAFRLRYLLGELDVVKNDERTLYVQNSTVIDTWCDVVVVHRGFDVSD